MQKKNSRERTKRHTTIEKNWTQQRQHGTHTNNNESANELPMVLLRDARSAYRHAMQSDSNSMLIVLEYIRREGPHLPTPTKIMKVA